MGIIAYTREGRPKAQGQSFAPQSVVMRAVKTTDTTATLSTTATIILFDTKDFDPYNWYDPTTGRWTPKIAGYYRVTGQLNMTAVNANESMTAAVRKNGVMVASESSNTPSAAAGSADKNVSALMYLNGTTDYADVVAYFGSGSTNKITAAGGADPSFIAAELIASSVGVAPEPWTRFTYTNSWADQGSPYQVGRYMRDPHGFVHIEGMIKNTVAYTNNAASAKPFTLPVGYRPSATMRFAVQGFDGGASTYGFQQIEIGTDGVCTGVGSVVGMGSGAINSWWNLNGQTFRAEG